MAIRSGEIDGLDELMEAFAKLGDDAMPYLKEAADKAGEVVLAKTKAKAPVLSGKLRDSLKLGKMTLKKGKYTIYSRVTFSKGAAYGVPLELGHRLMRAGKQTGTVKEKPFMRPAADESKNEVVDIITAAMNKALDEMGGIR